MPKKPIMTSSITSVFHIWIFLEPMYKIFAQIVGDVDVSSPMLCNELEIQLTKVGNVDFT